MIAVGIALQKALAGLVAGRVYPVRLPDAPEFPAIRYATVSSIPINTLCGPSNLSDARYRVDVFATTIMEAGQIGASIESIMRGTALGYKNVPIMAMDGYEPTIGIYRRTLDFQIWEAQPMLTSAARTTRLLTST
jgi:hypothetical protein